MKLQKTKRCLRPPVQDEIILDWWQSCFECVFLILHPFLQVDSKRLAEIDFMEAGLSRRQIENWVHPWTWQEVATLLGLPHRGELNRLLLMSIGAIRNLRPGAVETFRRRLKERNLRMPDEGELSELLIDDCLLSIQAQGFEEVIVGDEFGGRRTVHRIDALLDNEYPYLNVAHATLFPADESQLYCVHWDSFYTFLCGSRERVETIVAKHGFEGFYAEPGTEVYWYKEPSGSEPTA